MSSTKRKRRDWPTSANKKANTLPDEDTPLRLAASKLRAETDAMYERGAEGKKAMLDKIWPFFLRKDVCFPALWVTTIKDTNLSGVLPNELWLSVAEYTFSALDYKDKVPDVDILALEFNLTSSFQHNNQYTRAIFHLLRLVNIDVRTMDSAGFRNDNVMSNLSGCYEKINDYASALKWANRALECNPNSASGHYRKGHALLKLGQSEQAAASLSMSLNGMTDEIRIKAVVKDIATLKEKQATCGASEWSTKQVSDWVSTLGSDFSAVAQRFQAKGIDGTVLPTLDADLLRELGVADNVSRHVLMTKIKALF